MSWKVALLVSTSVVAAEAQQPSPDLQLLARGADTVALARAVRQRPVDARELLGSFIEQAGRLRDPASDSILRLARRLAHTYAAVWDDSFPVVNLARFERLSIDARRAKVAADSVRLSGNAALGKRGVRAAIALWRDALRRSLAVPDSAAVAAAYGNIGAGFYEASELDSAESYLGLAKKLAESIGDRRTALNAVGVLGAIAMERGNLRRAQEMIARTLELRSRVGDVRGMVADHTNLGLISAQLDGASDARTHYGQALQLAREHELEEPAATALLNLGNIASIEGEYAEAATSYRQALAIYRSRDDKRSVALVLQNLGLLALRRGDYGVANSQLTQAHTAFARVGTLDEQIQVRRDLATVEAARGNMQDALGQLRRADQLLSRVPERPDLAASVALARADVAVQLNLFARADADYARAQSLYHRAGDASGETEAQQGRAMLLLERKQYARVIEQLRVVERRQLTAKDRRPVAITRLVIGYTQHQQGNDTEARRTLERARDTLLALGDVVSAASALSALADLELERGAPLAAEALYRRALETLRGRTVASVSWQLRAGLGRALRARGALAEAAAELRTATAEVERMASTLSLEGRRSTFLADKWDVYTELALIEKERGNDAAAFLVSERLRGRQLLEQLSRGRVVPLGTADTTILAREHDLRQQINELTRRLEAEEGSASTMRGPDLTNTSSGVTREALARAQEQYAHLLLDLADEGGTASIVRGDVADWRVVAARLQRGQALLTYLVTDTTTMVFVLTPDTMRVLDLGVSRDALTSMVDFARGTMSRRQSSGHPSNWRAPLRRLHQYLLAPIEDGGLLAGVRQLTIVPHAELHYLPFAALMSRTDRDEFLIERYDIAYAPSASAWVRLAERKERSSSSGNILALAPRANDLPGSRQEVEAIRRLYGRDATVLANGAASEQAFRETVQHYGIVHLATYGVLNQHNPLFSFVDLRRDSNNDGRLEVHEVFGLSMNARLLVLSACQTALASGAVSDVPAGDDWVGLVRAFLAAGTQNVIATLWAVEDRATAGLMERLHRRLRAGQSEVAALSEAQRETLRNQATSGPFYWAGFVLVGGR